MMRFHLKDPAEDAVLAFNFSDLLADVASATVAVMHDSGDADGNASALLDGDPQIDGLRVLQAVHGGVLGANYLLRCTGTDSAGTVKVVSGLLPVRAA